MNQMDILSLSCSPVWGVPEDGVFLTAEAYVKYSVAAVKDSAPFTATTDLQNRSAQQQYTRQRYHDAKRRKVDAIVSRSEDASKETSTEALSGVTSPRSKIQEGCVVDGPSDVDDLPSISSQADLAHPQQLTQQAQQPRRPNTAARATPAEPVSIFQPERSHLRRDNILPKRSTAGALRQVDMLPPKKRGGRQKKVPQITAVAVPGTSRRSHTAASLVDMPPPKGSNSNVSAANAASLIGRQKRQGSKKKAASSMSKGFRWSNLHETEHEWFLQHQGKELIGDDAAKFETLAAVVALERRAVIERQFSEALADPRHYAFVSERALRHMEVDDAHRRLRTLRFPRLYQLKSALPLPQPTAVTGGSAEEDPGAEDPLEMWHLQQMHHRVPELQLAAPRPCRIPLHLPYLPSEATTVTGPSAEPPSNDSKDRTAAAAAVPGTAPHEGNEVKQAAKSDGLVEPHINATSQSEEAASRLRPVKKEGAADVSRDPLAARFVRQAAEQATDESAPCVAIAASAFETLMATPAHDVGLGWEIAVEVCQEGVPKTAKTIFINKPLMPRTMTMRRKHERLYKHALVSLAAQHAASSLRRNRPRTNLPTATSDKATRPCSGSSSKPQDSPGTPADTNPAAITRSQANKSAVQAKQPVSARDAPVRETRASAAAAARASNVVVETDSPAPVSGGSIDSSSSNGAADAEAQALAAPQVAEALAANAVTPHSLIDEFPATPVTASITAAKNDCKPQSSKQESLAIISRRGVSYDLWQLGQFRLVVRAHESAVLYASLSPDNVAKVDGPTTLLPKAKMEYLTHKEREAVTRGEAARWWVAMKLRPDAAVLLGRITTATSDLQSSTVLTAADVREACDETGWSPKSGYRFMSSLLSEVGSWAPGSYLLTHSPTADHVSCFTALPAAEQGSQAAAPLPCSVAQASGDGGEGGAVHGVIYDLHSAHASAGSIADNAEAFVPMEWRPFNLHIAQIPGTFPVRVRKAPKPKAAEVDKERRRQRRLMPSAWAAMGVGGDWDCSAAQTTDSTLRSNADLTFSKQNYLEGLAGDELE